MVDEYGSRPAKRLASALCDCCTTTVLQTFKREGQVLCAKAPEPIQPEFTPRTLSLSLDELPVQVPLPLKKK